MGYPDLVHIAEETSSQSMATVLLSIWDHPATSVGGELGVIAAVEVSVPTPRIGFRFYRGRAS